MTQQTKTILLYGLNSPGHINSQIGIADKLKEDFKFRTVFVVAGPTMGTGIQDHGHELYTLPEKKVYEDYEIEPNEEVTEEVDEEEMKRQGRTKKKFPGASKWPQLLLRYEKLFRLDPVEAFVKTSKIMEEYMLGEVIDNHEFIAKAIEDIKPVLVIVDSYYIPPCIVNLKHIPWVKLHSANPLMVIESKLPNGLRPPPMSGFKLYTKQERERMRNNEPEKWQAILSLWGEKLAKIGQAFAMSGQSLAKFLAEQNCDPLPPGKQSHDSPHLNLYLYPKAIDYDQDDDIFEYGKRWFGCDSLIRKPLDASKNSAIKEWESKLAEGMKGKKELVFVSLGSVASGNIPLMTRLLDLLKDDKSRLYVVSKGVNGNKYDLPNPENMIGGNYIPQTYLLGRSNLAIVHGGNNSVSECLYYGCPTIVLPCYGDQTDNAQRIEDLSLGKRVNPFECSKEELNQAINEVLSNKTLIDRCREIGKQMRARDDSRKISALIKKLVDDGKLDQEFIDDCRNKDFEDIKF